MRRRKAAANRPDIEPPMMTARRRREDAGVGMRARGSAGKLVWTRDLLLCSSCPRKRALHHCEEREARRSNPGQSARPLDCFVASLLAMTTHLPSASALRGAMVFSRRTQRSSGGSKSMGRRSMTRLRFAAALGLTILATAPAHAWTRGQVDVRAVLPAATGSVEGITVGPDGNVYAPTFGFNTGGALGGNAKMFVISPGGNIVRSSGLEGRAHSLCSAQHLRFGLRHCDVAFLSWRDEPDHGLAAAAGCNDELGDHKQHGHYHHRVLHARSAAHHFLFQSRHRVGVALDRGAPLSFL